MNEPTSSSLSSKEIPLNPSARSSVNEEKMVSFAEEKLISQSHEIEMLALECLPSHQDYPKHLEERLNAFENKILLKAPKSDPYQLIERSFNDGDHIFGKEHIERMEVKEGLIEIQKKKMTNFKNKLEGKQKKLKILKKKEKTPEVVNKRHLYKKQIESLRQKIDKCEKTIARAEQLDEEWFRSSYFRDLLEKHHAFDKAAEEYLSAPVNLRYHTYENNGFCRLGVITDPRNGWTNLQELKDIHQALKNNDKTLLLNKISFLIEQRNLFLKKGEMQKVASIDYALAGLKDIRTLEKNIAERRNVLTEQMLQLVIEQVNKNQKKITSMKSGDTFDLVHLSLLNPKNSELDKNGWMHDETNSMLDMVEIFTEFGIDLKNDRAKKLIFDGEGPFIDDQGNIHLPKLENQSQMPQELILDTIFLNISVQGHTKNDGIQREINQKAFQKIKSKKETSENFESLRLIEADLGKKKSSYKIAEELSIALLKNGMILSIGCLSAKDRTGVVADRIIIHFFEEDIIKKQQEDPVNFSKSKVRKLIHLYRISLFNPDSPAVLVVKDNTGSVFIKCSVFYIHKFSEGISGKIRRLSYFEEQAKDYYRQFKRKKIKKLTTKAMNALSASSNGLLSSGIVNVG